MAKRAPTSNGMQMWSLAGEPSLAGEHERQKKQEQGARTEARNQEVMNIEKTGAREA